MRSSSHRVEPKVVVNDLGGTATGGGKSSAAADLVVEEIKKAGGDAIANYDSVEEGDKIVKAAVDKWNRIDVVVNNAGILRDSSFKKMSIEDWDLIYRVHVAGSMKVTKAAWDIMLEAGYGRLIFTASAAGIYGNFGQANYAMAKLGLVGFSNTLALEGKKKNVHANTIAPIAGSRLTETVLPKEITDALKPEYVSPLVAYLAHESCEENGGLFEVGGGLFAKLRWERTEGKLFKLGRAMTPEQLQKSWGQITDFGKSTHPTDITASMQPILGNLNTKALGGNEFIDVDTALGYEMPPANVSWDERDVLLYALGVGATDLQYVYENNGDGFRTLPTFAVVPALKFVFDMAKRGETVPGMNYGFDRILHGEQYTRGEAPAAFEREDRPQGEGQGHLGQGERRRRRHHGERLRRERRRAVLQRALHVRARRRWLGRRAWPVDGDQRRARSRPRCDRHRKDRRPAGRSSIA